MPSKLSFSSLSINALMMLSLMIVTVTATLATPITIIPTVYAEIQGDTDLITIEDARSSCNLPNNYFGIYWTATGFPDDAQGWFIAYLDSSTGERNIAGAGWNLGIVEQNRVGAGFEGPLSMVGEEPYTLTVYEATGPDPEGPGGGINDIIIKEGGYTASITFTCADLDPVVVEEPPTIPLTERFKNQGQCVSYANANPDDEDVTKELCQEAFTDNRRSNRA